MNECSRTKEKTAAWLNGTLDEASRIAFETHCASCPECGEALETARWLRGVLRETAAYPISVSPTLDERIHRALVAAAQRRRTLRTGWGSLLRPVLAAAALLCLITVVALIIWKGSKPEEAAEQGTLISRAEVKAGEPVTIELAYETSRSLPEVEVAIELGEGLSFFSGIPAIVSEKRLRWSGPLTEGRNLVPFVVTVERPGTWRINTTATYEGHRHRHRIVLSADGYTVVVAQYRLPPESLDAAVP